MVTIFVLLLSMIGAYKSKKKIAVRVERVLLTAAITIVANLVTVVSETENVCAIAYSVFFAGMTWLLYFLFAFIRAYTNITKIRYYNKKLMIAFVIFDSIMMYSNFIFGHVFSCREMITANGEIFYRVNYGMLYNVHLGFCYMLASFSLLCLVYRIYVSPRLYRRKYLVVLIILICILLADAVYVFYSTILESSVIFLAMGGLIVYYYAIVFEPKTLTTRTLDMVVEGMTEAVVTFDIDGNCIQMNKSACEILNVTKEDMAEISIAYQFNGKENIDLSKDNTFSWIIERNKKIVNLKIQYHRIVDERDRYLGCFFVIEDETEAVENLKREHYFATHDRVTGLYNKEFFYEQSRKCLEENDGEEMLMICSDVKNFKLVNDVFGTRAGDELLSKIANEIKEQTKVGEIYGRLESDRFALLMKKKDFKESIFIEGPKTIAQMVDSDLSYPIHIYVGVYEITDKNTAISVMCARALMAANTVKDNAQKYVAYYDDELRKRALSEQELASGLEYAMETEQFQIYLQPQVAADGSVPGAEALVRWIHPEKGMVPPGNFLPILEQNGSIAKLDRYVWEQACKCLKRWKDCGNPNTYISINISPIDFYFMDIYKVLMRLVDKYEISPKNLKIEITETAFIQNLEELKTLLKKLQEAGFVVEMDDFGSGYSSLNMLKNINVDAIKLDMAFLGESEDKERGRKILTAIVKMSKELELPVITEGVETSEQVDFLKEVGCNMFQGYYFAKPMEVQKFEEQYL